MNRRPKRKERVAVPGGTRDKNGRDSARAARRGAMAGAEMEILSPATGAAAS